MGLYFSLCCVNCITFHKQIILEGVSDHNRREISGTQTEWIISTPLWMWPLKELMHCYCNSWVSEVIDEVIRCRVEASRCEHVARSSRIIRPQLILLYSTSADPAEGRRQSLSGYQAYRTQLLSAAFRTLFVPISWLHKGQSKFAVSVNCACWSAKASPSLLYGVRDSNKKFSRAIQR